MRRTAAGGRGADLKTLRVDEFLGIDLENSQANRSPKRSPDAPNMIRDVPGKVRKRMGYHRVARCGARINGIHAYTDGAQVTELIHAGTKLYIGDAVACTGLADEISAAYQLGGVLYLLDGQRLLCYDGTSFYTAVSAAYVPTLTISRAPSGGGTAHEALNLIGRQFRECFTGDGQSTVYQLSYTGLDGAAVTVEKKNAAGSFVTLAAGADYTADAALGQVSFTAAPPVPADGADNIRITAGKTFAQNEAMIEKCRFGVLYGVNGDPNRLFLSGNPDYPNRDWHSGLSDGSYFPQDCYAVLGLGSAVRAYSVSGNYLAAHKRGDGDGRNIIIRSGVMADGKAAFPIVNALQGAGTLSPYSVAYAADEPLFLTDGGVMAVTTSDIKGERYEQNRSYYVNAALAAERGREEAQAAAYRDFYALALGGRLYLLDTLQKASEAGAPYAAYQLEAYRFENIPARVLVSRGGRLRFGTDTGDVMEFYTDPADPDSYCDDGGAIAARWDMDFSGSRFYKNKRLHYLALRMAPEDATSFELWVRREGIWKKMLDEQRRTRVLCFDSIDFDCFSFSCDRNPVAIGAKVKAGRFDAVRLSIRNEKAGQPMGLYELALEFSEENRYRR